MATIKKCDRCGKARKGKYFTVTLAIDEQGENEQGESSLSRFEPTVIPDCCEVCSGTITNCVTLKKKPRKAKPRSNAKPRARKPRGKTNAQCTDDFAANANTQAELPTPNGAPAKPSVPPPPEA